MSDSDHSALLDWLTPLLRRWKLVVGLSLAAGIAAAVVSLLATPVYTAHTSFVPEGNEAGQLPAGLAGLAGQFGLTLGAQAGASPDFFAQVLVSRELLDTLLSSTFQSPPRDTIGGPRTLLEMLDLDGETEAERRLEAVRELRGRIIVRVDRRSQMVHVSVDAESAVLAADMANRLVVLLNEFHLARRQSRSQAQRRFVSERLEAARSDLRDAEAAHLEFISANRRFSESPVLQFEENRLQREVQLRQEVYNTLAREYEQARIAEVRDTPLLTIIDHATPPDRRSRPRRKAMVLMTIFVTGMFGAALAYVAEYRRVAADRGGPSYERFLNAWRDFVADLPGRTPRSRAG